MKTIRFADVDVANAIAHKGRDTRFSDKYGNIEHFTDNIKLTPKKTKKLKCKNTKSVPKVRNVVATYVETSSGVVTIKRDLRTNQVKQKFPTAARVYWERANGTFSPSVILVKI